MDSAEHGHDEAAKVRSKRLQYLFGRTADGQAEPADADQQGRSLGQYDLSSVFGTPVASSTMVSSNAGTLAISSAEPTNAPTAKNSKSTAVVIVNGDGITDLLKSIQRLLSERRDAIPPPLLSATASSVKNSGPPNLSVQEIADPGLDVDSRAPGAPVCSDSSDGTEEIPEQKCGGAQLRPLLQKDWKKSLPSTSTAGFGDDKLPVMKRRPGRPKGSKNKRREITSDSGSDEDDPSIGFQMNSKYAKYSPNKRRPVGRPKGSTKKSKSQGSCASESLVCHICRESRGGEKCSITDCGHLFHKKCLDKWIQTSCQRYRTHKTCPYCGGKFANSIRFFG